MKIVEVKAVKEFANTFLADPILKMAVNAVLDNAPEFELVRCKDCKHWLKDVAGCTDSVGRCEWANYMVGAVGYCVYGERKEK